MILTRFVAPDGAVRCGRDRGDGTAELFADGPWPRPDTAAGRVVQIGRRLAPVMPPNVFCIGLNYREHAEETSATIPERPVVFMKPTTTVSDPGGRIVLPAAKLPNHPGPEVDSEAELAVVIGPHRDGRPTRDVRERDALDHVLGYTCANDVSARRWQKHGGGGQWVRGKGFDTFCPLGPVLVTPGNAAGSSDEGRIITDPQALAITGTLNGEVMQSSSTSDMIFSVAELIAFLSRDTTLLPGTVILTGTPPGVGFVRTPPVFLKERDEVAVQIAGIGVLRNPVVRG
ncbi:MAG: fumarylacetoacetate hydrolase family protein [Planctomycetota bacterium]